MDKKNRSGKNNPNKGYDPKQLYALALDATKDPDTVFIADVVAVLPCGADTFYRHFPKDSDECLAIKRALYINRTNKKKGLRKNWHSPDASANLQIALYKLLANTNELRRLNGGEPDSKSTAPATIDLRPHKLADDE